KRPCFHPKNLQKTIKNRSKLSKSIKVRFFGAKKCSRACLKRGYFGLSLKFNYLFYRSLTSVHEGVCFFSVNGANVQVCGCADVQIWECANLGYSDYITFEMDYL